VRVVFLCSPGNPTGTLLDAERDIRPILECPHFTGVVVVDEAYVDFSAVDDDVGAAGEPSRECPVVKDVSMATWTREYENLIVVQTLSKSFGLAGIRWVCCASLNARGVLSRIGAC
jgi:histidinol-phosphate aminotransferase